MVKKLAAVVCALSIIIRRRSINSTEVYHRVDSVREFIAGIHREQKICT